MWWIAVAYCLTDNDAFVFFHHFIYHILSIPCLSFYVDHHEQRQQQQ